MLIAVEKDIAEKQDLQIFVDTCFEHRKIKL
jgi:hypothetical protein